MENKYQEENENDYIIIPNPIYDVVFRYLMEDIDSAIIVISTLLNVKIKRLHLEPLTHAEKKPKPIVSSIKEPNTKDDIQLFHLDFTAVIELPDGSDELIMIEVQKASEPEDIFRFKRYISKNFQKKQSREIINPNTQAIETIDMPLRLVPIFILNFRIENEIDDLLIKTNHFKQGVFRNRNLEKHNEFIDNLTYDILVVQLPNLHKISPSEYEGDEYKTKLYALLKLFDQKSTVNNNNEHRLKVMRRLLPGFLERVVLRLQAADSNYPDLEEQMFIEDEYLKALIDRDNKISYLGAKLEEKDKALVEKDKALEEASKMIANQQQIILNYARQLKAEGKNNIEIQANTGLPLETIEKL
ncbi:MAG: hypothetical protein HC892_06910 [Saprospiraceae bacterium]|nr:hypothetical protein [Saprospiraceae bacterium]